MFSITLRGKRHIGAGLVSLMLLAACGGGKDGDTSLPEGPTGIPLADTYTEIAEGVAVGAPNWPDGSGTGTAIGGVGCVVSEQFHVHGLISIYMNGQRMALPAKIGLLGCTYEMHTHDAAGIVHIEADGPRKFTLGQFFAVWGETMSTTAVAGLSGKVQVYLIENEKVTPFRGDPATIEITAHREIAIVIGEPPAHLDRNRWPSGL